MIKLKVTPDGGDAYTLTASARDILNWEKATKGATFTQLMANPSVIDLYRIAHLASRRLGMFTGTLAEFEETCEVKFELEAQDPEPDPS